MSKPKEAIQDIRIIIFDDYGKSDDPVKTEDIIFNSLKKMTIDTDYVFAAFPIAWTINTKGLRHTQDMIDRIEMKYGHEKLFYVCQHIQVENLNFHGKLVFTPHATRMDNYAAIPHYSPNACPGQAQKPFSERKILCGFRGAFKTHKTRTQLKMVLGMEENCSIVDTGDWHFYAEPKKRNQAALEYAHELGQTKVALCPRGTGPSTIRFWEAMASGCVPLVISDHIKYPLDKIIEWEKFVIQVRESDVINILKRIPDEKKLEEMAKLAKETFNKHFSNDKLHASITRVI